MKKLWISDDLQVSTEPAANWNEYILVKKSVSIPELFTEICNINGVTVFDLLIKSNFRGDKYAECRYWHWLLLKEFDNLSWAECGEIYKKDHATALCGVKKLKTWATGDKIFQAKYEGIISMLIEKKPDIFEDKTRKKK